MGRDHAKTAFIMISGSGVSGAEKRFARTFLHLRERDSSYSMVVNQGLYDALAERGIVLSSGVEVLGEPLGSLADPLRRKLYLALYPLLCHRYVRQHDVRAVHLLGSAVYYGALLVMDPRVRVVISNYDVAVDRAVRPSVRPLFSYVVRHADAIDSLSDDIRDRILASKYNRDGCLQDVVHVMPCSFADYEGFESAATKRNSVVFLGSFFEIKRPMLLVEAIPAVLEAHPDTEFLFLGRGPLESAIRNRVEELGVGHATRIEFALAPEEYLSESSIFVSLQVDNNYPSQSLLEAMACENAVVATDVGETWKLVDDETGIRVAPAPKAVASGIIELLSDRERMREMGRRARRRVLTEHTIDRATDYLRQLHLSVQH